MTQDTASEGCLVSVELGCQDVDHAYCTRGHPLAHTQNAGGEHMKTVQGPHSPPWGLPAFWGPEVPSGGRLQTREMLLPELPKWSVFQSLLPFMNTLSQASPSPWRWLEAPPFLPSGPHLGLPGPGTPEVRVSHKQPSSKVLLM